MRYTTILDVTGIAAIWRNKNAVILYYHMAMNAGYSPENLDIYDNSLRNTAQAAGLTLSACRHALGLLLRYRLVERCGSVLKVTKIIAGKEYAKRPKPAKARELEAAKQRAAEQQRQEQAREERQRTMDSYIQSTGKSAFIIYLESIKAKAEAGDPAAIEQWRHKEAAYKEALKNLKQ